MWGLVSCAKMRLDDAVAAGLLPGVVACSGEPARKNDDHLVFAGNTIPTCPRCAVLRDAALEGRLPERNPIKENQP